MKQEIKLAFHYIRRYGWMYLLGIAALLAVDVFQVIIPRMTGQITDGLTSQTLGMPGVWQIALRILLMGLVVAIGRFGWRYFLFGASRLIERDLRNDMFSHLETLSQNYFNQHKTGDLMAHFTNDLQAVRQLLGMTIITTFDASVMLILVLTNMIRFISPRLTLVAVLPMIAIIFGDIFFGKAMHRRFLARQEAFSELTDYVQESVSGIRVIKAFVQERKQLRAFARVNQNTQNKNMAVVRLVSLVFPLLDLVIGFSMLLTLLYGGKLAIDGEITLGQFVAFNSYVDMLVWPMIAVGECISSISQGMASLKRIRAILQEKPEITDESDGTPQHLKGNITLNHLTFTYPDSMLPVLQDITLTVQAGETLAIIGRTGSGKTTLASLIERLYDTEDPGMICMDGIPLRLIPLSVLHEDIAYVPQDHFLFSDTVANNIAFGKAGASREEIEQAAMDACVHDNIIEFPKGYDTLLGERGVTISGGQKQRTSIARALLRNAPVLIMDDALSAVDTDTEEQILQNLRRLRSSQTTILIAHRISTIQHADHILVLDEGKMAEYGTHQELMALHGIYRSIWEKQQLERQLHEEGGEA